MTPKRGGTSDPDVHLIPGNDKGYRQATVAPGYHSGAEVGVKVQFSSTPMSHGLKAALCHHLSMGESSVVDIQARY